MSWDLRPKPKSVPEQAAKAYVDMRRDADTILPALFSSRPMTMAEVEIITGLNRLRVYDGLDALLEDGLIKGVRREGGSGFMLTPKGTALVSSLEADATSRE